MRQAILAAALATGLATMLATGGCAAPPPAQADPFGPLTWMVAPTQGRPALVKIGSYMPVMFRVPADFDGRVELTLLSVVAPHEPRGTVRLPVADGQFHVLAPPPGGRENPDAPEAAGEPLASAMVGVPDYVPAGLYDLQVAVSGKSGGRRVKLVPRAVAVYETFPAQFRFVQISNMNVGGATATEFPDELVEEVNRFAPAFIITTGDYTERAADGESWRRVKRYFARFDAPVFLMAGDLDHADSFDQWVAPSRSGQIAFGACHGVLLHDNYRNAIDADPAQFLWLDSVLKDSPEVGFHFLVSSNDSLRVFDAWRKLGASPAGYVRQRRIGMIFVGGYSDWDFVEHADKLDDVPLHYIRTHASSTTLRGKATGVPHYRVVQVSQPDWRQLPPPAGSQPDASPPAGPAPRVSFVVPEDGAVQRAQHSIPVGMLKVDFDGPNDASRSMLTVTVLNRLTVPVEGLRVKLRLRGGGGRPTAIGGQIERVIDRPGQREVWLRIDCPDLGVAKAVVGPASELPLPPADVQFVFLGDRVLRYQARRAPDGFAYYATDGRLALQMTNRASQPRTVWPIVRLNGNVLSFRRLPADEPIVLAPGEERTLALNTPLGLASPGEHWLTVGRADDPLSLTTRQRVELIVLPPLDDQPSPAGPVPASQPAEAR